MQPFVDDDLGGHRRSSDAVELVSRHHWSDEAGKRMSRSQRTTYLAVAHLCTIAGRLGEGGEALDVTPRHRGGDRLEGAVRRPALVLTSEGTAMPMGMLKPVPPVALPAAEHRRVDDEEQRS